MKRRVVTATVFTLLLAMVGLVVLSAVTPTATATDSTGEPLAQTVQQAAAEWTISADEFTSTYPDGFTFVLHAESSAGPIVSARVEWQHRPHIRARQTISVRRETGVIDAATGTITATWTPSGATGVPPWVAVYYTWTLRDAAGNEFTTERAMVEYADTSRPWTRLETDDAIIFSEGMSASVGELVGQALVETREKYLAGWGATLPYKPRVILFHDFASFNEWQRDSIDTTSLGYVSVGLTSDAWGGTAQVLYGTARALAYETVLHEVEHLHQYEFIYPGRTKLTPGWFIEGDARFYEALDNSYDESLVYDLARGGRLPTLLQGVGPSVDGQDSLRGYAMGYMFWKWLTERWGMAIHAEIMALLGENLALNDALEAATGLDPHTLEREWRAWLGATPLDPPTLFPTPTMLPFLNTPTPFGR